ncbi:MAG: FAD-dependent oxidoreductase [Hyphomicrobiaceae bacterium]|nr:FAD-dependent oxidoreductase [Hyphomicrobiaceae bacterium]
MTTADRASQKSPAVTVTVIGAGIVGLWQALTFARAGFSVRLADRADDPFAANASRLAGAMLAPDCEAEAAPVVVRDLGRRGLELWRQTYPGLVAAGSLVVAPDRDRAELERFARMTERHRRLDRHALSNLEPGLAGRFAEALHFPEEAHMTTPEALAFLLDAVRMAGATVHFGAVGAGVAARARGCPSDSLLIDCRGIEGADALSDLRGVRGERIVVRTSDITLARPLRFLHPRHPIYIVPWSGNRFLVGATVIESSDSGPASVRSVLELLGAAYAVAPAFAEAEVVEIAAGVRPAFPDNVPRVVAGPVAPARVITVNGAYRHGFLLAPVLAEAALAVAAGGAEAHPLVRRVTREPAA